MPHLAAVLSIYDSSVDGISTDASRVQRTPDDLATLLSRSPFALRRPSP